MNFFCPGSSLSHLASNPSTHYTLHVFITKWSAERVHDFPNRPGPSGRQYLQIDGVVEMELGARRVVEHGPRAADGVLPLREVAVLPQVPEPVDLSVM